MRSLLVTWGQDSAFYADQVLQVPEDATAEQVVEIARAQSDKVSELDFEPNYEWSGLRIVSIMDSTGRIVASDIPVEPSGEDLGIAARGALAGRAPLQALLHEADRQGIATSPYVTTALEIADGIAKHLAGAPAAEIPESTTLVVGSFSCSEFGDGPGPDMAIIEVTPAMVNQMLRLAAIGKSVGIRSIHVDSSDGIWNDPDAELRMSGTEMVVMPCLVEGYGIEHATVFWRGRPKHADCDWETYGFDLRNLLAALTGNPEESHGFTKKNGALFWDGGNGMADELMKQYFSDRSGSPN